MSDDAPAIVERVFEPAGTRVQRGPAEHYPWLFSFTGEDVLELTSWNTVGGAAINVQGRVHTEAARVVPFSARHVPTSDRVASTTIITIPRGELLNVVVFLSAGAGRVGQTFIRLSVLRGTGTARERLGVLCQGRITHTQGQAFPGSPISFSVDDLGLGRVISGTLPDFGQEISEVVPTGARWQVRSVVAVLSCDATVATRQPVIAMYSGASSLGIAPNPGSVAASQTAAFYWTAGFPTVVPPLASVNLANLPIDLQLAAANHFQTSTASLQAGDRWSAPTYVVTEWLEGN